MSDIPGVTLVLGGARSGKTAHALALAEAMAPSRVYCATAQAHDAEMEDRIARHRAERGAGWRTLEEPLDLAKALGQVSGQEVALIDCLTLWLSNLLHAGRPWEGAAEQLLRSMAARPGPVILVSNEVGLGIVPETTLGRTFRDAQGRLNQMIAARVARVEFVAAGLPLVLKG